MSWIAVAFRRDENVCVEKDAQSRTGNHGSPPFSLYFSIPHRTAKTAELPLLLLRVPPEGCAESHQHPRP
jgi:hypothetical protein